VTVTSPTPSDRPAGGLLYAGWFLCAVFFLYAFVHRVAPSVMVDDLMRDFAVGGAALGNLSAFYYYAYAGSQIPVGVLFDRFGPRRLITAAGAVVVLGSVVFATAETLWLANLGRLMIGFGCAFSFAGALNYAALWLPPGRFATLGGWAQMLGVVGGIAGQAPAGAAVEAFGWRPVTMVLAVFGVGLTLAFGVVLRDKPRAVDGAGVAGSMLAGLRRAAGTGQVWLAGGFGMAMTASMLAFAGLWGVPYIMEAHDLTKAEAAGLVSILFVGWGIGAPLLGWLSDRLRRRRALVLAGGTLATLGIAAAIYTPGITPPWLGAILFVQGLGASSMVLCFAVARENTPAWAGGATLGIVNTLVVGSGAIMQPLLGWALDTLWDGRVEAGARVYSVAAYETAFLILPATCAAGVLAAMLLRETHGRTLEEREA